MRFLFLYIFFLSLSINANEYNLSWYPKDNYFDSIKTPDNIKYSLLNTEGVWEDRRSVGLQTKRKLADYASFLVLINNAAVSHDGKKFWELELGNDLKLHGQLKRFAINNLWVGFRISWLEST